MSFLLTLAVVLLGSYLVCVAGVALLQRRLLYFPTHDHPPSGLTPWYLDGRLIGYARRVPQPRGAWLFLHGNGGQASQRDYVLGRVAADESLYVLEYPGYGDRPGPTTRATIQAAAAEAWAHLRATHPGLPLGLAGESLGSGPACWLAGGEHPPARLALFVPFDRLADVAASHYPGCRCAGCCGTTGTTRPPSRAIRVRSKFSRRRTMRSCRLGTPAGSPSASPVPRSASCPSLAAMAIGHPGRRCACRWRRPLPRPLARRSCVSRAVAGRGPRTCPRGVSFGFCRPAGPEAFTASAFSPERLRRMPAGGLRQTLTGAAVRRADGASGAAAASQSTFTAKSFGGVAGRE